MSEKRYFYGREDSFTSGDLGEDFRYIDGNVEHDDDEDDSEFLQDIPYSSSSLDRSSIGSIPWADDAIKKNQLDWERVEKMLSGEADLPEESELRNEILEWQSKFPHLMIVGKTKPEPNDLHDTLINLDDALDIDSISNLTLNDDDDDDNYDGLTTPTNEGPQTKFANGMFPSRRQLSATSMEHPTVSHHSQKIVHEGITVLDRDLRINSVPLMLRKRNEQTKNANNQLPKRVAIDVKPKNAFAATILSPKTPLRGISHSPKDSLLIVPPSPGEMNKTAVLNMANVTNPRMRMPPILNVLESKRRFRGLSNNRSFVQLTHIQQAKSAAAISQHNERVRQSAWQVPLAAATMSGRFFNNRNSIILPAINLQGVHENTALTSSSGDVVHSDRRNIIIPQMGSHDRIGRQRAYDRSSTTTTTLTTTPSTGRSISAAVHPRSRHEFNAFYVPYSASKFKLFK